MYPSQIIVCVTKDILVQILQIPQENNTNSNMNNDIKIPILVKII